MNRTDDNPPSNTRSAPDGNSNMPTLAVGAVVAPSGRQRTSSDFGLHDGDGRAARDGQGQMSPAM